LGWRRLVRMVEGLSVGIEVEGGEEGDLVLSF